MPQSLPRTSSSSIPTPALPPLQPPDIMQPADADDSIVLSDLLRTGEASRLRRRGALRMDHSAAHQLVARSASSATSSIIDQLQMQQGPPAVIMVRSPTWDAREFEFDRQQELELEQGQEPALDEDFRGVGGLANEWGTRYAADEYDDRADADADSDDLDSDGPPDTEAYDYTLYCGGEEEPDLTLLFSASGPSKPSPLPLYPPHPLPAAASSSSRRTNGCGAVVHVRAAPQRRMGVWCAKTRAEECVVPMDAAYFDQAVVAKILRSSCGCVKEGIGCAICGNPLGTRYKPCATASVSLLSLPPNPYRQGTAQEYYRVSNAPFVPPSSSPSAPPPDMYIYTFFGAAVSAAPPLRLPPPPPPLPPARRPSLVRRPPTRRPSAPTSLLGRPLTASPAPLPPAERAAPQPQQAPPEERGALGLTEEQLRELGRVDPDGETLTLGAGPDKPGEGGL